MLTRIPKVKPIPILLLHAPVISSRGKLGIHTLRLSCHQSTGRGGAGGSADRAQLAGSNMSHGGLCWHTVSHRKSLLSFPELATASELPKYLQREQGTGVSLQDGKYHFTA